MTVESPDQAAVRFLEAAASHRAIHYGSLPDKELPEIQWSVFGLPASNEIAVIASVGALRVGIAQTSDLVHSAMEDRIYGLHVIDGQLAHFLSETLWDAHSHRLIDEAINVRSLYGGTRGENKSGKSGSGITDI